MPTDKEKLAIRAGRKGGNRVDIEGLINHPDVTETLGQISGDTVTGVSKRDRIREMAREIYINSRDIELLSGYCEVVYAINQAQYFYDRIEEKLDKALGGEE
jgi:hypothetical protein